MNGDGNPEYEVCCNNSPHGPCGAVLIGKIGAIWKDLSANQSGLPGFTGACRQFVVTESRHSGFNDICLPSGACHSDRRRQSCRCKAPSERPPAAAAVRKQRGAYYFTWAGGFDGPQPLGMWDVGSRRILWLRREAGVLRTACDGWDGCTWGVYSGSHPHLKVRPSDSIERALADIAFTRTGLPEDRSLVLAEFVRRDKDALASVVLIDRERMVFADYHAEYRGEGEDLWRVDDGGSLDLADFGLVFLLQRGSFYAMGIAWSGTEGLNLSVFVSSGDARFTKVIADYWYQAPF